MNPTQRLLVGATGESEVVVTPELTVGYRVPGMPLVYGTPFMIWLMEVASTNAAAPYLPGGLGIGRHRGERQASCGDARRTHGDGDR